MAVIFLFIDGVGLGAENARNPLNSDRWTSFSFMTGGKPFTQNVGPVQRENHFFTAVDATLGMDGLPQSGTGQAALFSGQNAAKMIGKHFGPFPHSGNKNLLNEQSLFIKAQKQNNRCTFINAYPDIFFQKAKERNRWSCTTLMTKSAGIRLNTTEDIKNETALSAGITQKAWRENLHIDVPVISPEEAARRLLKTAGTCDLLLHEYYLTDKAGHSRKRDKANEFIARYDRFLWTLIRLKAEDVTLVLCSDHGNIENLSTKSHTLNKVPLFVFGPGAKAFHQAKSIMDVTPGILDILR